MNDATRRTIRTLLQLLASGALTALVDQAAGGLSPAVAGLVLAGWQIVVTFAHNAVEDATGKSFLKTTPVKAVS